MRINRYKLAFVVVVAGFLGTVAGVVFDSIQDYRSFAARLACEQRRMTPRRRAYSTRVTCVPISTRQDTTTVNVR